LIFNTPEDVIVMKADGNFHLTL